MKKIAIIAEYNPFHYGHKYQIDKIREEFGKSAVIIALMSGNYTQRGELAFADKTLRGRCAVLGGVNLCLEIPFPFSMSSAEFFASSAVHILNSLGGIDYLSFGSEAGDIEALEYTARAMMSKKYNEALSKLILEKKATGDGYPKLCEEALISAFGKRELFVPLTPNNILAIEYIKALKRTDSTIIPHTVKRFGSDYKDETPTSAKIASASAVRNLIQTNYVEGLKYMPMLLGYEIDKMKRLGYLPTDEERLSSAVITSLRMNTRLAPKSIHDAAGGLFNRLYLKSLEANTIENLVQLTQTKRYTTARIKRALWYSTLGVTSSEMSEMPLYTQLLGMDKKGRGELRRIKSQTDFPILTKPSRTDTLSPEAKRQKERCDLADSIYQLAMPTPPSFNIARRFTPFVLDE